MLARPELLLPLAFSLSGLMIVVALVLLRLSTRQSKLGGSSVGVGVGVPVDATKRPQRGVTLPLFSGATVAALDEAARQTPARKRQARIYA
jgi:hypothetical protein